MGIKTRALESRKETHERYIEMLEECKVNPRNSKILKFMNPMQAQGEYTSSLEEEVQNLD